MKVYTPDIIHETYYSCINTAKIGPRRVVTVYDMIHEIIPESFSDSHLTTRLKRETFDRADHIICISENTRKDLINIFGLPEDKASVVYLGYDQLIPKENPDANLREIVNDKPYLLFVGSRGGYKNANRLINAYGKSEFLSENYTLVFFGGGAFTQFENEMISTAGLTEKQVYQVSGDDGDLAFMYKMASAFVYPSLYEGFGIPPLEAMSLGCPVICSNTSSIPEVVADAAELFTPDDTDDIQTAIENVMFSIERRTELVNKGFDRCKLFTWERCAKETFDIYKEII